MKYKNFTLTKYLKVLSAREPIPGGGSAAALSAALGAALLGMVARYSVNRGESAQVKGMILKAARKVDVVQSALLRIVDDDAAAYLKYSKIPKSRPAARKKALRQVAGLPKEVCRLCARGIDAAPLLVSVGNPYLLSDIEVAVELFWGAHRSAMALIRNNQ